MIRISPGLLARVAEHGEHDYPGECCGLVLGRLNPDKTKTAVDLWPVDNAKEADQRHNRFLIPPGEFVRGELAARRQGLDVVGIYHSHPDHPAVPSEFDLVHAWPSYSYLIVAVGQGRAGDLLSWELKNDRSGFSPESLDETEESEQGGP